MDYFKILDKGKKYAPNNLRKLTRKFFNLKRYDLYQQKNLNPYSEKKENFFKNSPLKLGIIKEFFHYHKHFISACEELGISYKVIDISGPNWMKKVNEANCDGFLVWPNASCTVWNQMYKDRCKIMEEMGYTLFPSFKEMWLYENKKRTYYWLCANDIPAPKTWIFYDYQEALNFVREVKLPIVFKTNVGACSSGVKILKERKQAIKVVKDAFKKGIRPDGFFPQDKQWGSVFLQEYFHQVCEWRMVRIGDSFFGHRKKKFGEYHSGSHQRIYDEPPIELLNRLKYITDLGGFRSMDVDFFETKEGDFLVNELQTVFGVSKPEIMLKVQEKAGRFIYSNSKWVFEEGDFSKNACCNERVNWLIKILLEKKK